MKDIRRVIALMCVLVAASCGGDDSATEAPEAPDNVTSRGDADPIETGPVDAEPDGDSGESTGSTAADPVCALAADEEISEIIGNDVAGTDLSPTLCEYSLATGQVAVDGTSVDVTANDAFDEVCSLEFDVAGTSDATPVDDVGKIAKWDGGTQTSLLFVCTGTSFFVITQYTPPSATDDQVLARAKAIARLVINRR